MSCAVLVKCHFYFFYTESFKELIPKLGPRLTHSEHVPVELYWDILSKSDVVVSTALHEFFGVAM